LAEILIITAALVLNSLSLRSRFLIAPLIGVLLTAILYLASNEIIRSNNILFQNINATSLVAISEIHEIESLISVANSDLVTLLLLSIDGLSEEELYVRGKKQIDRFYEIEERLNQVFQLKSELIIHEKSFRQKLLLLFSSYKDQVISSIEMSSVDLSYASQELALANKKLKPLNRLFLELSNYYLAERSQQNALVKDLLFKKIYITELAISLIALMIWSALYFAKKTSIKLTEVQIEQGRIAIDLMQLIDTANAPIFGIDTEGKINEWNQQAEQITGYKKDEVIGRKLVADFIADDYKLSVGAVLSKALQGEETANYEFPLFTHSGARVDVLLNSSTRRDALGQIVGVVGVGQDITELNQLRVEQDRDRKEAAAQMIQASKLATLGEMATSVAHELNQPLNVIRMAAENGRRQISKGTADLQYLNGKLERIDEQTARAAAIIDHMRMFGREAKEEVEAVDPRKVVMNALSMMGEQLRLAGIEVVTELAEDCPSILCHPIQLEQVLLNLMTNGRDAMATSDREPKITLQVFAEDESVRITCEDSGGGIPEDTLPRIFEPFYTTKELGKGTGLGLSVSYGIIRDINGTIVAKNIDDGARFTITLPSVS
jgi:PAS domain S-box-containing protein